MKHGVVDEHYLAIKGDRSDTSYYRLSAASSASLKREPFCEAAERAKGRAQSAMSAPMCGFKPSKLCTLEFMNERPQIVKHLQTSTTKLITSSPPTPVPSPSDAIKQTIEVSLEPERLERLDVTPAPTDLTMTDWQQEFEFNRQESVLDAWDCEVDDLGNDLW